MLLVLTGSFDGTADLIFGQLKHRAFRLNFDTFAEYEVSVQPNFWSIRNPAGLEITSKTATAVWWWKAFNYSCHDECFITEEVKYIFRELYGWFLCNGKLIKGNSPDFHRSMGKMNILSVAQKCFSTPKTWMGWGFASPPLWGLQEKVVAKSLSSGLTTTDKALFTTEITGKQLASEYPWYLQDLVVADADVTIFVCRQRLFAFARDRANLKGLDWRAEQNFDSPTDEWARVTIDSSLESSVLEFCRLLNVDWGRLDFMQAENRLIFLEYNANGQWVFLDCENQQGLLDTVCEYLLAE